MGWLRKIFFYSTNITSVCRFFLFFRHHYYLRGICQYRRVEPIKHQLAVFVLSRITQRHTTVVQYTISTVHRATYQVQTGRYGTCIGPSPMHQAQYISCFVCTSPHCEDLARVLHGTKDHWGAPWKKVAPWCIPRCAGFRRGCAFSIIG